MREKRSLPLDTIRIIDITTTWAGPVCTAMLADMGAEVIKIENPSRPDPSRRWIPYAEGQSGLDRSGYFAVFNRGKKDCILDLKQPQNVETVKNLVKTSDILVENYSPTVMDKLGLGYSVLKEIKPNLIMVSLSGYGATGPDRNAIAYGTILEAFTGLSSLIGYPGGPPLRCGTVISDHLSAITAAFITLVALHHRYLTGEGQHIDISETETLLTCMPKAVMEFTMNRRIRQPSGNRDDVMAPHGCYRCQGEDKWVAIAVGTEQEWRDLCLVMNRTDLISDKRFRDGFGRLKNQDELDTIISEWTAIQTPIDIMEQLQKVNIACGPVYSAEDIYSDRHLRARAFFEEIDHPEVGKRELPGVFAKLSKTPGAIRHHDPLFGEHTDWLLREQYRIGPSN